MPAVGQEVWVVCRSVELGRRVCRVYPAPRRVVSADGDTACLVQRRDLGDLLEFWARAEVYAAREDALSECRRQALALRADGWEVTVPI
jgi:hypothetical protein